MAADTTIKVEVDSSQAQRSLQTLKDSFAGLKSAILGIGFGALIQQANQLADSIQDLSDATEVSSDTILGFSRAVAASGGSFDGAQKAISKLVVGIDEAASKSGETRAAFMDIGVSLRDLQTLSSEDIFKKTIEGLSKIDDVSKRNRLSAQLLGKEFKSVNLQSVGEGFGAARANSAQFVSAIKSSAEATDKLSEAMTELKLQILVVLKPINDFIKSIPPETITRFIQAILTLGMALATLFVAGRVIRFFILLKDGIYAVAGGAKTFIEVIKNLYQAFGIIWKSTAQLSSIFARLKVIILAVAGAVAELAGPVFAALKPLIVPIVGALAAYWGYVADNIQRVIDKVREYASIVTFGLVSPPSTAGAGRGEGNIELEDFRRRQKQAKDDLESQKKIIDGIAKARLESKQSLEILKENLKNTEEKLKFERNILGLNEDQKEIAIAVNSLEDARRDKIGSINREIEKLTQDRSALKANEIEQNAILSGRIRILQNEANEVNKIYNTNTKNILSQIAITQEVKNTTQAIDDQISRYQQVGDVIKSIVERRGDVAFERSLLGKGGFERDLLTRRREIDKFRTDSIRALTEAFTVEGEIVDQEGFNRAIEQVKAATAGLKADLDGLVVASRRFDTGWGEAFENYVDRAKNSAEQAREYFEIFSRGFENIFASMIRGFPGIREAFKGLINDMIAQFLRLQAQKAFLALFGDEKGGGMLMNFFRFAGGRAAGGQVNPGQGYMVGERGPEMFIPNMAGKIIPNNQLTGGNNPAPMVTNVNYTIQAVDAQSFRSLVARDPAFIYAVTERGRQSQP
ncbi:MAG: hypothetical protein RJA42_291, partial [Bacteroidota bacterium]